MSTLGRLLIRLLGQAALAGGVAVSLGSAQAQAIDCYDRALPLPATITAVMADSCHAKVSSDNTTNDRHAIALYNAARFLVALGDGQALPARKTGFYDRAIGDLLESRDRAGDDNVAFTRPWRKADKRSQAAQMEANRYIVANRSYLLARAYSELGKLDGSQSCPSRQDCYEMAAAELEKDLARGAGAFHDTYVFLRASVYADWGQSAAARRDLEFLRSSPAYGAAASQMLGEIFLADARRQLSPPLKTSSILAARVAYRAAVAIPTAALAGQLGVADTFLMEAERVDEGALQRARLADAAREFGLAIAMAAQQGSAADRLHAHEGRGAAQLKLVQLGDARALEAAIKDLEIAAGFDMTSGGAPAQLMLARALVTAGHTPEADAAYTEAARRFGLDPRADLARAEQAFVRGKALYSNKDYAGARTQFEQALAVANWQEGRADAFLFMSEIDLQAGRNAVSNADAAVVAGGGAPPYRAQACLARVAAGGSAVKNKSALATCLGDDLLIGLFYLRHAQLSSTAASANESRRLAQDSFTRARLARSQLWSSSDPGPVSVSDLAVFGNAVALGCSSTAGLDVPVDLSPEQLAPARAFFELHRVHSCVASR